MPATRLRKRPTVAIVGRANVGKSTLWNRVTETGRAIVSEIAHTTRDRNYAPVLWRGGMIDVIDTGGLDAEQGSEVGRGILRQAELAIREADLVLFLVDVRQGVIPQDKDLARHVRKLNPHILLLANKSDNISHLAESIGNDLWNLGLGEPARCSAATGRGVGDVLDLIYRELEQLGKHAVPVDDALGLKIVIMGRPNVGKSSLLNAILGEERVITSSTPHTTREPMDTQIEWRNERVTLVDTAGMRKRSRVDTELDAAALERNREALMRSDVAFLVIDATEGGFGQDQHLAGLLEDAHKGLAIVVNKWDLVPDKTTKTAAAFEQRIRGAFPFLAWAPMVFVSALHGKRVTEILEIAFKIREERRRRITPNALQKFLKQVIAKSKPIQSYGPQSPYIHDVVQIGIEPPSILIQIRGQKANLHESWLRFFENRLREKFGFEGTPVEIKSYHAQLVRDEMPEHIRNRPTRKKRPIGRRVGRY